MNDKMTQSCNAVCLDFDDNVVTVFVSLSALPQASCDSLHYALRCAFRGVIRKLEAAKVQGTETYITKLQLAGRWTAHDGKADICGVEFYISDFRQEKHKAIAKYNKGDALYSAYLLEDGTAIKVGTVVQLRTDCSDWYFGKVVNLDAKRLKVDCSMPFKSSIVDFILSDIYELEVLES